MNNTGIDKRRQIIDVGPLSGLPDKHKILPDSPKCLHLYALLIVKTKQTIFKYMRTLAFLVFLVFIAYALAARWYYVCKVKNLCEDVPADVRLKTLQLTEGDTVLLEGFDQFAFDSASVAPRLNENNQLFLDTLAAYLQQYPDKNLTITSFYRVSESEIQPGFYENIGVARAAEIRKELMKRGIEEQRVSLDHGLSEDEALQEPLLFELYVTPEEFAKVQFSFTNMTFSDANFAFDSDEFRPGEPFLLYADSVKIYLDRNEEEKLTIIGHTDNIGQEQYNYNLGMRRAKSAREYFRELGVVADIEVDSKGETVPVAANDSAEGRQKNRRVNFVLEDGS